MCVTVIVIHIIKQHKYSGNKSIFASDMTRTPAICSIHVFTIIYRDLINIAHLYFHYEFDLVKAQINTNRRREVWSGDVQRERELHPE